MSARTYAFSGPRGGGPAILSALAVALLCLFPAAPARGADVARVEEDWELIVDDPDAGREAPQVTCAIAPTANLDGCYAAFEINHGSQPTYVGGGLQLQLWNGEAPVIAKKHAEQGALNTPGEVVRWTSVMALTDGALTFSIVDGTSATWGNFGPQSSFTVSVASSLGNLNQYSPSVSTANSGIGYANNRVTSLKLLRVRKTDQAGIETVDSTVRTVFAK